MSIRALRKVLQQQEAANNDNPDIFPTDDQSESSSDSPISFSNPFDLLIEQDDQQHQENESSDVDTSFIVKNEVSVNNIAINSSNKNSKKKKKRKKSKESSSRTGGVYSLDTMLEDLSFGVDSFGGQYQRSKKKLGNVNGSKKRRAAPILQVNLKFLSAANELRRIFGSEVVDSNESIVAGSSRLVRPGARVNHSYKKTVIISPSDHWPWWDGSLSMELLKTKMDANIHSGKYVHSSTYRLAQRKFEAAQATLDLDRMANILSHHPYHIDSLITLAEFYKHTGELQISADATAQALYALECAWHPLFNPSQNKCQLKYNHATNRPFFTTLFAHMKNVDRRGCHRTAMELCKLLISLDSDDPTGALFCLDYFSLLAEEYEWLERFSEEYDSDISLWLYPNFSYSFAICRFYLERKEHGKETETKVASSDLMKQALMLHPSVVRKLVVKVPLKARVWSTIVNHCFFGKDETGNASLDRLINIYVEKSYLIWRIPELNNFLKDTALSVIETIENDRSEARNRACVREAAFASNKNKYSHLMVSDFSDSIPTIPQVNLPNFMIDPRFVELHNNANQEYVARAPLHEVAYLNALEVLFESMLPWVDYGTPVENDSPQDNED